MWERDEPILPMTGHWEDADFSVANVVRPGQDVWAGDEGRGNGTVSLRDWSIKLLSRYAYTVGKWIVSPAPSTPSMPVYIDIFRFSDHALALLSDPLDETIRQHVQVDRYG